MPGRARGARSRGLEGNPFEIVVSESAIENLISRLVHSVEIVNGRALRRKYRGCGSAPRGRRHTRPGRASIAGRARDARLVVRGSEESGAAASGAPGLLPEQLRPGAGLHGDELVDRALALALDAHAVMPGGEPHLLRRVADRVAVQAHEPPGRRVDAQDPVAARDR